MLSLVEVMDNLSNSFEEDSGDLYRVDTKDVMGDGVVQSSRHIITIRNEQYMTFVKERFIERSNTITDSF